MILDIPVISGEFVKIEADGEIVAFLEYDWVRDAQDMLKADRGETPLGGDILYVSNIRVTRRNPKLIWELRRQLPPHRWIVGLDEQWNVHAPKGLSHDFFDSLVA